MPEPTIVDVGPELEVVLFAAAADGQLARVRIDGGIEQDVGGGEWRAYLGTGADLASRFAVAVDAVLVRTSPAATGSLNLRVEQRLPSGPGAPGQGFLVHDRTWTEPVSFLGNEALHSSTLVFAV